MAKQVRAAKECVVPGCSNPVWSRGLCDGCYKLARKAVVAKETTWEALEAKRLAVPRKRAKFIAAAELPKRRSRKGAAR